MKIKSLKINLLKINKSFAILKRSKSCGKRKTGDGPELVSGAAPV